MHKRIFQNTKEILSIFLNLPFYISDLPLSTLLFFTIGTFNAFINASSRTQMKIPSFSIGWAHILALNHNHYFHLLYAGHVTHALTHHQEHCRNVCIFHQLPYQYTTLSTFFFYKQNMCICIDLNMIEISVFFTL